MRGPILYLREWDAGIALRLARLHELVFARDNEAVAACMHAFNTDRGGENLKLLAPMWVHPDTHPSLGAPLKALRRTPPPFLGQLVGGGYHATSPRLRNMLFRGFVGARNKVYHCPLP